MNSIDQRYKVLLQKILDEGVRKQTRNGEVLSIFSHQIRHNMVEGFPLLTTKKMAWKSIVTELLWFLRGDTNIKYLVDNDCHIWDGDAWSNYKRKTLDRFMNDTTIAGYAITSKEEFINKIKTDNEFAKQWGELGPIYGKQWREWTNLKQVDEWEWKYDLNGPIDQIANLISELKTNPDSRRLMVNAWNVGELDQMVLPPCHYGFQVYTRELGYEERYDIHRKYITEDKLDLLFELATNENLDKLGVPKRAISLMWNQRSVDTFLGLPFNIASYALLLEIIAKEVNMVPEDLIGNLGDCHLYNNHIEQAKEQLTRSAYELPKLHINTEFWQTESGECGVGALKTDLKGFEIDDFQIENYKSHPSIKAPLSN